jgi:hypothetical protein
MVLTTPLTFHVSHNQKSHGRGGGQEVANAQLGAAQEKIPTAWVDAHVEGGSLDSPAGAAWSGYISPGPGYDAVQTPLRTRTKSQRAADMQQAFRERSHVTTEEITVYRGVSDAGSIEPGQMIFERGFSSTSTDHDVADQFAQGDFGAKGKSPVRMEITLPTESAVMSGDISLNELILNTGAGFVVDSIGTDTDGQGRTIRTAQVRYVSL